jgi:hypothetical protein
MQPLTAAAPDRPQAARGRWIWRLSGAATVAVLAVAGTAALVNAGNAGGGPMVQVLSATKTVTVPGTVTSLTVGSYGGSVRVVRGPVSQVTVVEAMAFVDQSGAPAVTTKVSHGELTLAAPSCASGGCTVGFTVTVPTAVTVSAASEGGDISVAGAAGAELDSGGGTVSASDIRGALIATSDGGNITASDTGSANLDSGGGTITGRGIRGSFTATSDDGDITVIGAAGATLDSGGGFVTARQIGGPLTATTDDGALALTGLSGSLTADTAGGPLTATGVAAPTSRVTSTSGSVSIRFTSAPQAVQVSTGGGSADLELPGGPYAVSAQLFGAPEEVSVPTSPAAARTISADTDGGALRITRAAGG